MPRTQAADPDPRVVTAAELAFPLFHTISVPMTLTRVSDGCFLDANASFCALVGFDRNEVLGRTSIALGIQPSVAQREEALAIFKRDGFVRDHDITMHAKDGSVRSVQSNLDTVNVEGVPHILGVLVDVTARRMAERALAQSEAQLRLAFAQSRLGITLSKDGKWTDVNPAFCRMLDRSREELLAIGWRGVTHPDDLDASYAAVDLLRDAGPDLLEITKRFVRRDGTTVWAEVHSNAVRSAPGEAPTYFTYVVDITERRRAEAESKRNMVGRALMRRVLRDLVEHGAGTRPARRALGRTLARDAAHADLAGFLDDFAAMNIGDLELVRAEGDRFEFAGRQLLEHSPGHGQPTCHIVLGYVEGAVAALHGDSLGAETRCQSQGHDACHFVVKARRGSARSSAR